MTKLLLAVVGFVVLAGAFLILNTNSQNRQTSDENTITPTETTNVPQNGENETSTVTLTEEGFEPKTLTVKTGTKVVWINKSGMTATVDSAVHSTHLVYPRLNLGDFTSGESLELVFDEPGTYIYHNHLNASQNGIVIVN